MDFANEEASRNAVNDWSGDVTDGHIDDLINGQEGDDFFKNSRLVAAQTLALTKSK